MWKARDLTSLSPCSNCSFFILLVCWWHNFNSSKILYSDNSRWELTFAVCIWNVRPVDGFIMIHLREWSLGPNLRELGLVASISGDMCAPRDRTMAQYPHPLKKELWYGCQWTLNYEATQETDSLFFLVNKGTDLKNWVWIIVWTLGPRPRSCLIQNIMSIQV